MDETTNDGRMIGSGKYQLVSQVSVIGFADDDGMTEGGTKW